MNILVVGGAGYIGSHMVKTLLEHHHSPVVFDNFSTGHRDAVLGGELIEGDLSEERVLDQVFSKHRIDAVMHFASLIQVGESIQHPARYFRNNVTNTVNLLDAMGRHGVDRFVFSSSAAIFGEPERVPIDEAHPKRPINPYGRSKLMVEEILASYGRAYGLRSVSLRYFNAAGADPDGKLGERHEPETHLIPLVLQAASGRRDAITIFGDAYDTPDGTCIRDYIHVVDLCEAHLLALDRLEAGAGTYAFNLGNGSGFSNKKVISTAESITGRPIPTRVGPPREGDPARLVADPSLAHAELGWRPRFAELEKIIEHAWRWEQQLAGSKASTSA